MKLLSLEIDKMVGALKVSLSKEDISSGINLIFGPNGSGKTSICRAITRTLWPETLSKGERLDLRSIWHTQQGNVAIDLESSVQKTSSEISLPPSYLSRCFVITIDDLFDAKDQDLATRILQEAHGGCDPEEVRKAFTLKQRHGGDGAKLLMQAKETLRKVESKHAELAHQEKDLKRMVFELEEMKKTIARKGPMQNALKARGLEVEIRDLSKEMDSFPPGMDFLKAEDKDALDGLRQKEDQLTFHIKKIELQILEQEEKNIPFSPAHVKAETIALFEKTVQEIHQLSASLDRTIKEKAKLEVDLQEKLRFLMIQEEDFEKIDIVEIEKMAEIYSKKEQLALQEKELYARLDLLVQDSPTYPTHALLSGIGILKSLSVSQGNDKPWVNWLLGAQGLFFVLYGLFSSPIFFLGLVFPVLLWKVLGDLSLKRRKMIYDYTSLGLPVLQKWDAKEILLVLENLLSMLGKRQRYEIDHGLVIDAEKRLSFVEEEKRALEGVLEDSFSGKAKNNSLALFLDDLKKAKEDFSLLLQKKRELLDIKKALDHAYGFLEEIAPAVDLLACSPSSAQVALEHLRTKRDQALAATYQKKRLQDDLQDKKSQLELLQKEIDLFFDKRKIPAQQRQEELISRLDLLSSYNTRKGRLLEKKSQRLLVEKDKDLFADIFEKSSEELTQSLALLAGLEKKYEQVLTEKAQLEERIQSAKKGHELAEAKKNVENATLALKAKIKEASLAVMGEFLLQKVESSYRQESSLVVFDKICEYFSLFTKGKYIFKAAKQVGKETEFFVEDTESLESKKLGMLSRGTRMQLLLAVRIAFSDLLHSESLPLFLDEALHTADQERFGAIASVLFQLANKGRQIFYLTSKFSDIGLLQEIAKDLGKEISYIDLERKKL